MTDKPRQTTAQQLKTLQKAVDELIKKYAKLDKDFTEHVVTPDAHNSAMLARKKKEKKL